MKALGVIILAFLLLAPPAAAMVDPAAAYCEGLGYVFMIESSTAGEMGVCVLPSGDRVSAWDFLQGRVGQEYSYCAMQGWEQRSCGDSDVCAAYGITPCVVCILPDGREAEVTDAMGIDLYGVECGDGVCGYPETHESCPDDCPAPELEDGICTAFEDGVCDPDCGGRGDPDCTGGGLVEGLPPDAYPETPAPMSVFLPVLAFAAVFLLVLPRGRI